MRAICAIVASLVLAGTTFADTINVPGDQPTIAAAISASVNGDVIQINSGTYYEHSLDTDGKAITIQGTLNGEGSLATTIDAQLGGGVFYISSGEGEGTVIKDLVITGGLEIYGGGIACWSGSSPTISGCTITNNMAHNGGGGISCYNSNPTLSNCTISGNMAYDGGGIHCWQNSNPTITGCTITNNEAYDGGGIWCHTSQPTISGCTISGNQTTNNGGGIWCDTSQPTISGCTITGNEAYNSGSGIYCTNSSAIISGSSVCGNSSDQTYLEGGSYITSALCWIAASCDDNPYIVIVNQQEQINQLLTMHDQQQSQIDMQQFAIEDLQKVVAACCATKTCAGDENNDGVVNIDDLLIVISVWGPCP